jgi:hypothetical protein
MGFGQFSDSDESTEDENQDPSGTHLYFFEQGHDRLPNEDDVAADISQAYELAKSQPRTGPVRALAGKGWEGGLQHMLAEFVIQTGEFMDDDGDPFHLIDWFMDGFETDEQVQAICRFMDDHPDVAEELADRLASSEAAQGSKTKAAPSKGDN